jgi:hypothetical protein
MSKVRCDVHTSLDLRESRTSQRGTIPLPVFNLLSANLEHCTVRFITRTLTLEPRTSYLALSMMLKNPFSARLLKKVQVQGGAP